VHGAKNCTTGRNPTLADLAYASDNKLIIYQFKRGFMWGMYKKKGLRLLWAEQKETSRRLVLPTARRVPDVMFFLPVRRVPDMQ